MIQMMIKPMRSLFWRIFLALWLGSAVLMIGSSLLVAMIAGREVPQQVRERVGALLRGNALSLLRLHGRIEEREFAAAVLANERDHGIAVYFVDERGQELLGRPIPQHLIAVKRRLAAGSDRSVGDGMPFAGPLGFGERVRAPDGRVYLVLGSSAGPPMPSKDLVLNSMLMPLLLSVLLAGFFSAVSARYLVRPIDDLRRAARQLATGDLASRVGDVMRQRRDEFGALAADFDRMADRIGALIGTQRQLMLDLSHELRSPLARLRVAIELMRDRPRAELLDRIERDADRMDILIGEILLLARLESPASDFPKNDFDPGELLADIVEDARLEIVAQPRTLYFDAAESDMTIVGDRELVRRAVENVVRNALQHTSKETDVHVSIAPDGDCIRIRVTDSGMGFSVEAMNRVFAPFARGDSPRQRQGCGLGLAIARAAVQRHGGTIVIFARENSAGSIVDLHFPALLQYR